MKLECLGKGHEFLGDPWIRCESRAPRPCAVVCPSGDLARDGSSLAEATASARFTYAAAAGQCVLSLLSTANRTWPIALPPWLYRSSVSLTTLPPPPTGPWRGSAGRRRHRFGCPAAQPRPGRDGPRHTSQLDPNSDEFTWATRLGLERLQDALGVTATGSLALGDYVFLPGPVRVTTLSAKLSGRGALASHVRGERRTNRTRRARRAS